MAQQGSRRTRRGPLRPGTIGAALVAMMLGGGVVVGGLALSTAKASPAAVAGAPGRLGLAGSAGVTVAVTPSPSPPATVAVRPAPTAAPKPAPSPPTYQPPLTPPPWVIKDGVIYPQGVQPLAGGLFGLIGPDMMLPADQLPSDPVKVICNGANVHVQPGAQARLSCLLFSQNGTSGTIGIYCYQLNASMTVPRLASECSVPASVNLTVGGLATVPVVITPPSGAPGGTYFIRLIAHNAQLQAPNIINLYVDYPPPPPPVIDIQCQLVTQTPTGTASALGGTCTGTVLKASPIAGPSMGFDVMANIETLGSEPPVCWGTSAAVAIARGSLTQPCNATVNTAVYPDGNVPNPSTVGFAIYLGALSPGHWNFPIEYTDVPTMDVCTVSFDLQADGTTSNWSATTSGDYPIPPEPVS